MSTCSCGRRQEAVIGKFKLALASPDAVVTFSGPAGRRQDHARLGSRAGDQHAARLGVAECRAHQRHRAARAVARRARHERAPHDADRAAADVAPVPERDQRDRIARVRDRGAHRRALARGAARARLADGGGCQRLPGRERRAARPARGSSDSSRPRSSIRCASGSGCASVSSRSPPRSSPTISVIGSRAPAATSTKCSRPAPPAAVHRYSGGRRARRQHSLRDRARRQRPPNSGRSSRRSSSREVAVDMLGHRRAEHARCAAAGEARAARPRTPRPTSRRRPATPPPAPAPRRRHRPQPASIVTPPRRGTASRRRTTPACRAGVRRRTDRRTVHPPPAPNRPRRIRAALTLAPAPPSPRRRRSPARRRPTTPLAPPPDARTGAAAPCGTPSAAPPVSETERAGAPPRSAPSSRRLRADQAASRRPTSHDFDATATDIPDVSSMDFPVLTDAVEALARPRRTRAPRRSDAGAGCRRRPPHRPHRHAPAGSDRPETRRARATTRPAVATAAKPAAHGAGYTAAGAAAEPPRRRRPRWQPPIAPRRRRRCRSAASDADDARALGREVDRRRQRFDGRDVVRRSGPRLR